MPAPTSHIESHAAGRAGWLRAAVLGANDGLISTACLIVGVSASAKSSSEILVVGSAALVAGAMAMATGEYVSVSSQADSEEADLARERGELDADPQAELNELTRIYVERGLNDDLAREVAQRLMAKDALSAHARDELGITELTGARPVQAALTSAVTFAAGAVLPLAVAAASSLKLTTYAVSGASLVALAVLGAIGAKIGGARIAAGTIRVAVWGALAMAVTAGIGALVGKAV